MLLYALMRVDAFMLLAAAGAAALQYKDLFDDSVTESARAHSYILS